MPRNGRSKTTRKAAGAGPELLITRLFDAPRPLVFKAWTESDRVGRWFGPRGFSTILFESEPRAGGAWRGRMRSPEGQELAQHGVVREIVEPERFAFTFQWDGEAGPEQLVTVTLAERGDQTEMTFSQGPFPTAESRDSHREGWNESFDRLDRYLAGVHDESRAPAAV